MRTLTGARSWGPQTARAVGLFRDLDREIRRATNDEKSLDDVMQQLVEIREVSREDLAAAAEDVMGQPSRVLDTPLLR